MDNSVPKETNSTNKEENCTINSEDQSFHVEEKDEIDILNDNVSNETDENNDDADVYSSSFSGTASENENESDQEVESMLNDSNDTSLPLWIRKKKVTDHWKKFIHPIAWRCKWIELKMRELKNQARIYDKQLEEFNKAELEKDNTEELGVKGLPCNTDKNRIMKRNKRNRVEETTDVGTYESNHNLFSYYESRKTSFADIGFVDNNNSRNKTVFAEEILPLEFNEGDEILGKILLKIETAKLEARNLKNRVDKILSENPVSSSPVNVVTSSVIKNEDEEEDEEEAANETLLDILASKRKERKVEKIIETAVVEEGSSRPVRKRIPRNLDVVDKEENKPKKRRVSREKPKSPNVTTTSMASRLRKRKRGKRRSTAGLRKRS